MKAIVLSGGGARGAYEAGVWKALKKLHIHYDIVTGTSIGAINGMLMVQKQFQKCISLWQNINFDQLYDDFPQTNNSKEIYLTYVDKIINGGINTSKMDRLVNNLYKPFWLYHSSIKFGVVAYNLTTRKVVYATKENTKPDRLKDYIMASATCFPVFQMKKIDNDSFIDGGYYDNLPINLAIDLGADDIIAIDLGSIGIPRRVKSKEVTIKYIEPSKKLESFLMFEKNAANRMIQLGYLDGMKSFGRFEGKTYTFKKGTLTNLYYKYYHKFVDNIKKYSSFPLGELKKLQKDPESFSNFIEEILETFEINVTKIYNSNIINLSLWRAFQKVEEVKITNFNMEEMGKLFKRPIIIKYIYNKIKNNEKINSAIFGFFSKELAMAIYFLTIRS